MFQVTGDKWEVIFDNICAYKRKRKRKKDKKMYMRKRKEKEKKKKTKEKFKKRISCQGHSKWS